MSGKHTAVPNHSILYITTRGLVIKTPDNFLPPNGFVSHSEMQLRFLYKKEPADIKHELEIRVEIDGEAVHKTKPTPANEITITINNAEPVQPPRHMELEGNLINLNKIHGWALADLDPLKIELIHVNIQAPDIKPCMTEPNAGLWYLVKSSPGLLPTAQTPRPKAFARCIGAIFIITPESEISIKNTNSSFDEQFSIHPDGKNISIILDNDCLSEDENNNDFLCYYDVLNGDGTKVDLKWDDLNPHEEDMMVACNAIEAGNGRK